MDTTCFFFVLFFFLLNFYDFSIREIILMNTEIIKDEGTLSLQI